MIRRWKAWPAHTAVASAHRTLLLLLDYDGTLAPIVSRPSETKMDDALRILLKRLIRRRVRIAIISGRTVSYVKRHVKLSEIDYAGNHGLEIQGHGTRFIHPEARRLQPVIHSLALEAFKALRSIAGAHIEPKRLSIALHERHIPKRSRKRYKEAVSALKTKFGRRPLRWRRGKMVLEILPDVGWDKGSAASALIRRLEDPYVIAIGDDDTDEDLFRVANQRGCSVRIGYKPSSQARFYVTGQADVQSLLSSLLALQEKPS